MNTLREYKRITLYGLVQGIGFRPHVVRLAQKWGLAGVVWNFGGGVRILASAPVCGNSEKDRSSILDGFIHELKTDPPPLSEIIHIKIESLDQNEYEEKSGVGSQEGNGEKVPLLPEFRIVESQDEESGLVILPPDLPVCEDCLREMKDPADRRYLHPLISCTHCGPRYSIIKKAPYDRCNTTMAPFDFCPDCLGEYTGVESRRFHAQTVSCHHCGPRVAFLGHGSDHEPEHPEGRLTGQEAINAAAELVKAGKIIAVKGIGGFHFLADPYSDTAVRTLRTLKEREQKPFAVCFPSLRDILKYAEVSLPEGELLRSNARPIVLLEQKQHPEGKPFSPLVLQNSRYIGAFLPYTPILVQLCESVGPVVATSANLSDAPIINREEGLGSFSGQMLAGILTHDREIVVSQDDSVAWVVCGKPQLIRRARGYTPLPVYIAPCEAQDENSVLALGGELKSTFCLQKGPFAYVSQYLGDLGSPEALRIYQENLAHMRALMKIEPAAIACDLHPDYATTRLAEGMGLPLIRVQHHHAHIASVMAEKGLEGPVLGVSFDGTGYGTDGTVWGGEFLICEQEKFIRAAYLRPIPMVGGDQSMRDCLKTATAYLHAMGLQKAIADTRYNVIGPALEHRVNTILSSSMGRLFDAVSSILGFCRTSRYEGEGAILLENAAYRAIRRHEQGPSSKGIISLPHFDIIEKDGGLVLDSEPLIKGLVDMLGQKPKSEETVDELALGFHRAVRDGIVSVLLRLRARTGIREAVLSGGVFQNRILTESTVEALENESLNVHLPSLVPPNDGGISLGQAFIAMKTLQNWKTGD